MFRLLSSRFPLPVRKGDQLIVFNHLKALSSVEPVILLLNLSRSEKIDDVDLVNLECFCELKVFRRDFFDLILGCLLVCFTFSPLHFALFYNRRLKRYLSQTSVDCIDIVYLSRNFLSIPKSLLPTTTFHFIDSMALNFQQRSLMAFGLKRSFFKFESWLCAKFEKNIIRSIRMGFVVAERDTLFFGKFRLGNSVRVLPNGVDIPAGLDCKKEFDVVFSGNLDYSPNIDAVFEVVKIYDNLRRIGVDIKILFVGGFNNSTISDLARDRPEFCFTGDVFDLRSHLIRAKVCVSPIFFASGLQNKVLEALACGLPVVTTPTVSVAFSERLQNFLTVAETTEEFSNALLLLLQEQPPVCFSASVLSILKEDYSWDNIISVLSTDL